MRLLDRLERKLRPYAVPNLTIVIIIGQALVYMLGQSNPRFLDRLILIPSLVQEGEVWRLISFCFIPPPTNLIFFLIAMMLFRMMGSGLEQEWGTVRYNLYLLSGYVVTVAAAFVNPDLAASNMFIVTSVSLAFAWLNPNYVLHVMFILPVQIRWLALLAWIGLIYGLITGDMPTRLFILAGIANFILFFGRDVIQRVRSKGRRIQHTAQVAADAKKPKHECVVCGVTDKSDTTIEFRYCSKCDGALCYCENHLRDHAHVGNVDA
jgi:hypothetical protein